MEPTITPLREEVDAFTAALDRYGKDYDLHWSEGQGYSFVQITPDAEVPAAQRAAAKVSQERVFEFLRRELGQASESEPAPKRSDKEPLLVAAE